MRKEARYLLHVWSDGDGSSSWRALITELATRRSKRFATLAELMDRLGEDPTGAALGWPAEGGVPGADEAATDDGAVTGNEVLSGDEVLSGGDAPSGDDADDGAPG